MEIHHGSGISGRARSSNRLKRKPFSDLTNTPSSPSLPKPKPKPKHKPQSTQRLAPKPQSTQRLALKPQSTQRLALKPTADPQPAFSSTADDQENGGDLASPASTPKSKETAADPGKDVGSNDKLDISTVSSLLIKANKKGKEKVVEAAPALSCPPLGRIRSVEGNMRLKDYVGDLHKAFSAPSDKNKKRKQHHGTAVKLQKPILPPDFIEKQRAYFAEIDAFELPEEEVSDGELE